MLYCCTCRLLRWSYRATQTFFFGALFLPRYSYAYDRDFEVIFHRVVQRIVTIRTKFAMNNITVEIINCNDATSIGTPTSSKKKVN